MGRGDVVIVGGGDVRPGGGMGAGNRSADSPDWHRSRSLARCETERETGRVQEAASDPNTRACLPRTDVVVRRVHVRLDQVFVCLFSFQTPVSTTVTSHFFFPDAH